MHFINQKFPKWCLKMQEHKNSNRTSKRLFPHCVLHFMFIPLKSKSNKNERWWNSPWHFCGFNYFLWINLKEDCFFRKLFAIFTFSPKYLPFILRMVEVFIKYISCESANKTYYGCNKPCIRRWIISKLIVTSRDKLDAWN